MAAIEPHRSRAGSNLILGRLDKAGCCKQRGRGRAREQAAARADLEHPPRARYMLLGERAGPPLSMPYEISRDRMRSHVIAPDRARPHRTALDRTGPRGPVRSSAVRCGRARSGAITCDLMRSREISYGILRGGPARSPSSMYLALGGCSRSALAAACSLALPLPLCLQQPALSSLPRMRLLPARERWGSIAATAVAAQRRSGARPAARTLL